MPTFPKFWRRRPRNDLDDYLAEVDDRLFCVSRADRRCLHRDLKAHARELTTDETTRDHFKGRYGITEEQLNELLGRPVEISEMYIRSVRKTPSAGMRIFLLITVLMGLWLVWLGSNAIDVDHMLSDGEGFYQFRGLLFISAGLASISLAVMNQFWYRTTYFTVPFICLFMALMAQPIAISLTHVSLRSLGVVRHGELMPLVYPFFLIQTFVVVSFGLYLALVHFRAFLPERSELV